ncbi:PDZ domain-containing protein [bacterium]|nr:PDZ domain-containing protein [bacterium]
MANNRFLSGLVLAGALALGMWSRTDAARPKDEMLELYGQFVDAVEKVEANYVRPIERKELLEAALNGMLQNLDPHSNFINTTGWKSFRRQIEGSFGGVGIQVGTDNVGRLKVIAPLVGSPAYEAGIMPDDVIMEIDGQSTEGMSLDRSTELMQGQPGTTVKVKVRHRDGETEDLNVNRAIIELPTVLGDHRNADDSWDYMLDKDAKIGYVRITSFAQKTAQELRAALESLKKQGMKGLVLDLRNNPGGLLPAAVEISNMFVPEGKIVSTKGRNTVERVFEAEKSKVVTDVPMVVLVNGSSASASEIVSAALQDHNRAAVVGTRSFGKGSVQNIIEMEDGQGVLKLTVATYWRPSGKNIHRFKNARQSDEWGVSPNEGLEVKLTDKELVDWIVGRRDLDLNVFGKRKATSDAGAKLDAETREKAAASAAKFVDKQRDKAIETVKQRIANPPAPKVNANT